MKTHVDLVIEYQERHADLEAETFDKEIWKPRKLKSGLSMDDFNRQHELNWREFELSLYTEGIVAMDGIQVRALQSKIRELKGQL